MGYVPGRAGGRRKGSRARVTWLLGAGLVAVFLAGARAGRYMREAELVDELRRVEVVGRYVGEHVVFGAEADSSECGRALREHLAKRWPVILEAVRDE